MGAHRATTDGTFQPKATLAVAVAELRTVTGLIRRQSSNSRSMARAERAGRWRSLLVTATFTGMRSSELRGLRWQDVDLDA